MEVPQSPNDEWDQSARGDHNSCSYRRHYRPSRTQGTYQNDAQINADRREQNATIRPQQDTGGHGTATEEPGAKPSAFEVAQPDDCPIHRNCCEENFECLRQGGGRVLGEKGTQRRHDESRLGRAIGNAAPGQISYNNAGTDVDQCLYDEHGSILIEPEYGKDQSKKRRIAWKAHEAGRDQVVLDSDSINAVQEPVFGKIGVECGVRCDMRRFENEKQPQDERRQRGTEEEARV